MKRSYWIEGLLLPPAVAVLHTAWVWLWVLWTARAVPPQVLAQPFSPVLLALIVLGGFAVTRWALAEAGPPRAGRLGRLDPRGLVAASGVLVVAAAVWLTYATVEPLRLLRALVEWDQFIAPVFLGLVACAFLWFQGIQLGRSALPQENLERAFYGGILALSVLFSANQLRPLVSPAEALTAALAFFATGLAGLALVSVENARRAEASLTGAWPALNRYWLGTVAGVIGSILLTSLLLASLLSPQTFEQLASLLNLILDGVTIGFILVAATLAFVLAWLLAPVLRYLAEALRQINFQLPQPPSLQTVGQQTMDFFTRYPALNLARRGLVLAALVAALALVFWWAVRRFARRARSDSDEMRENIATPSLLLTQLKNLLRRRPRSGAARPDYLLLTGAKDDPRLIVRRAYQALLEWAPASGLAARRAGQTPTAYAAALRQALPEGESAIDTLTGAYVQARYAAEAPSLETARAATSALHQLRQLSARRPRPAGSDPAAGSPVPASPPAR